MPEIKYPVCPRCGKEYKYYPSISIHDNETKICIDCGFLETIEDAKKPYKGKVYWKEKNDTHLENPMNQIEERKQAIYDFIDDFTNEKHYPPTIREIGESIGIKSKSLILYYLNQLIDDGRIGRNERVSRGIWIIR